MGLCQLIFLRIYLFTYFRERERARAHARGGGAGESERENPHVDSVLSVEPHAGAQSQGPEILT